MHAKWNETLWCRMYWVGFLLCRRGGGGCQVVSQAADVCISWPFAPIAATPCSCCRNLGTHYIGHSSLLNSVFFCIQHEISLVLCCHFSSYRPYYHIKCLMRSTFGKMITVCLSTTASGWPAHASAICDCTWPPPPVPAMYGGVLLTHPKPWST